MTAPSQSPRSWFLPAVLPLAALSLAVVGLWWTRTAEPHAPPRFATAELAAPSPSRLILPITVPLEDLAASVEAQVPEVVVDQEDEPIREGWLADVHVTRPGPVLARGDAEERLVIAVPLAVEVRAKRAKRAERRAERGKETAGLGVSFEAVIDLRLDLSVDEDWTLHSATELAVEWVDPPTLDLGPLKIPIRKPVERLLEEQLADVAAGVDARLAEKDAVRKSVERAWSELSEPRQLHEDPPVWLLTTPEALTMSALRVQPEQLELVLGFRGAVRTVLGDPGPSPEPPPLPRRSPPEEEPGFDLALPLVLPWDSLSETATEAVAAQQWSLPGETATLTVDAVELYPSGDRIAVRLDYTGTHPGWTTDGTVYLTARPELDPEARTVRLAEVGWVLDTWDSTVWSANALVQSDLEERLGERLVFPYGPELDAALAQATEALAEGRPTDTGGTIRGAVDTLELRRLALTEPALLVEIHAVGTLALEARPQPHGDRPSPGSGPLDRRR